MRNVGEGLVERIVAERKANGPFADIFDFCQRVDPVVLNKRTMESLVKGGRVRLPGPPAPGSVSGVRGHRGPHAGAAAGAGSRDRHAVLGLRASEETDPGWGDTKVAIPDTEFDKAQRLAFEKEMLGLYVSDHPLMGWKPALARHTDCTLSDMREEDADR